MLKFHKIENIVIAELTDERFIISQTQDALDLIGDSGSNNCNRIIIRERNLHSDFFRLQTGLAGEILQKFSNYNIKLAIVGDFSKYKSKNLQDFIRESNKGNRIFFVDSLDDALRMLSRRQSFKDCYKKLNKQLLKLT
ncbi:MAG: DUF4180 domain-containing protein [Bacteroidia bacterium]|nr:DUF4180 domain-containing protein [Bacteroidia bacterium]